jgi:release factor glutamine methyltransferase
MRFRTTRNAGGWPHKPVGEMLAAGVSVRSELARGAASLAHAGCEAPRLDAELLLAAALGTDRAQLVIDSDEGVEAEAGARYRALLARRAAREPIAYIVGQKAFRRIVLAVNSHVLIPRPETELLVEVGLDLPAGALVADVGTGSGAVALALKDERPDLDLTGIDSSGAALAAARSNGERLGLEVRWVWADLLDDVAYDAVLANLPYVADGDAPALPPEVREYEPCVALFAGPDGLDVIRRLVALVARRPSVSLLALEVAFEQAEAVSALVAGAGFGSVTRLLDLAGHERVIVGRR